MKNYTNKTIYLGMDVHKKTYAVTAICDGQVVKKDTLKADPEVLVTYCKKYFAGHFPKILKVRTEAGFMIKVFCSVLAYIVSHICKSSLI